MRKVKFQGNSNCSVVLTLDLTTSLVLSSSILSPSVGFKPKLGLAWLGFGSSFWAKKLGLARLTMSSKELGSARHILQKSSVQLSLLYDLSDHFSEPQPSLKLPWGITS